MNQLIKNIFVLSVFSVSATAADNLLYQGTISESAAGTSNGLEYKLEDSKNMTNAASAIAAATGGVLMATGVPMSMSIIAPVAAAGRVLIAKAIMEFAQAAANGSASGTNGAGEGILRDGSVYSYQSPGQVAAAKPKFPAELQDFLNGLGTDSDAFMNNLMSGSYKSEADILAALGLDQIQASEADLAEGKAMADGLVKQTMKEEAAKVGLDLGEELAGLDYESPEADLAAAVPSAGAGGLSAGAASKAEGAEDQKSSLSQEFNKARALAAAGKSATSASASAKSGEVRSMAGLFGEGVEMNLGGEKKALGAPLDNVVLSTLGVKPKIKGSNIFTVAHQNFRSFGKWQRGVAKRSRVAIR